MDAKINTTSKYVNLNVRSKQTLVQRPLPSIEILMCRKAKEMLEISQVVVNCVSSSLVEKVALIQSSLPFFGYLGFLIGSVIQSMGFRGR